jgi:putative ABC transport system ATP-binding protein
MSHVLVEGVRQAVAPGATLEGAKWRPGSEGSPDHLPLVGIRDVYKQYQLGETRVSAVRGINLDIEKGEFAAIWGPSGSGKTSLLNLIGLLDSPSSGRILIAGKDVTNASDDALAEMRNRFIGFVFQNFNLVSVLTALENVQLPLQIRGVDTRQARDAAASLLDQVGLGRQCNARPDQMSGGQRQRVAIARALVTNPAIVLADEPTANLDSKTGQQIVDLMHQLNQRSRVTFLFATHDSRLLANVNRHICLADGKIVDDRPGAGGGVEYVPA